MMRGGLLLVAMMMLLACGQKGALYLPQETPQDHQTTHEEDESVPPAE